MNLERKLEATIKDSVRKSLKGVKRPFGLLLSGGVDSGLLAALTKPDMVFTCRFPYWEKYDEFEYSRKVVKHLGLKQEVIEVTKKDITKYLPEALGMYGISKHFSLVPLYMLFKRIGEMGYENVLSGEGPDEYLGGYPSYSFILQEQKLYEVEELKNYTSALDSYLGSPEERFSKILGVPVNEVKKYWGKYKNLLSKMGYADLNLRKIEEMELALAEGFGVNLIYPYINKSMAKLCFEGIPDELKIKGFTTKYILKKVAEKYLPKSVVWRKNKMGGPVAPIGLWLKEKNEFSKDKYIAEQYKLLRHKLWN